MNMLLGFMGLGTTELMIVAGIFILLFGSTKLPGLARSIGKSANEFKKGIRDDSPLNEEDEEDEEDEDGDDGASSSDGDDDGGDK
jgi:sec-independent protein translocase protein TatA